MAVDRELTVDENSEAVANAKFQSHCEAAMRRFAKTWETTNDGLISTQIGQVGYKLWYLYHTYATGVMEGGFAGSETVAKDFMLQLKGTHLWDDAISPFDVDVLIEYMETQGSNKFDQATELYVQLKTKSIRY